MDPLTAIGLVSNIFSFIDFSAQLLKVAKEAHDSQNGVLEENRSRETIMQEMQRMSTRMLETGSQEKADDNSSLSTLAQECHELSKKLIFLLGKVKPKDPGSMTQSLASALRNKIYDSERTSLEARLNGCRAQLHLELTHLTSAEMLVILGRLIEASKSDETKLDRIESHIAQLRHNISSGTSGSDAKPMLMTLLSEEEKVFTVIARDRILNSLSFEGMNRRSNMVVETHSNTYEWILEDEPVVEDPSEEKDENSKVKDEPQCIEDTEKIYAKEKLRTWLESTSSRDVFHLSGKLGSGKSTLMKHIRGSLRTKEKLDTWAGGRKLTIANFYFWNIGSDHEKSLQGLYRSLLSQIFSQCPEFIAKVWPSQWKQANSAPWLVPKAIEICEKDVIQAFAGVMSPHEKLETHCFAFFIDGLDEFQSNVQQDHRDLVRLLCQWAAAPAGNIKICVSSREYPVFMDGFTPTLRIRFHDLTRRDMDTYIRDKLSHASREASFESLVALIMDKANGVFLWVALVVKSLREGLENGMSCSDLTTEVDILPEQLESLYRHILMSLGKSARRKAYQTFSMVTELKKHAGYRLSLLAYSFFEEYEAREKFFMEEGNFFPLSSLTGECGKARAKSASRKLGGWCKGLVDLYGNPRREENPENEDLEDPSNVTREDWFKELDFAHRSVSDFLKADELQHDMQLNLRSFDTIDAVINLMTSDILYAYSTSSYNNWRSGVTSTVSLRIMHHFNLIRAPFTYINRVRELIATAKPYVKPPSGYLCLLLHAWGDEVCGGGAMCFADSVRDVMEPLVTSQDISSNRKDLVEQSHYISDPLHKLTLFGLNDYPLWLISNRSRIAEQADTITTLACLCLDDYDSIDKDSAFRPLGVLEALFEQGWVSPDTPTNWCPTRYRGRKPDNLSHPANLTLKHSFVSKMLKGRYTRIPKDMTQDIHERIFRTRTQYDGKLFELFLRYKTDMNFSFKICENEAGKDCARDFLLSLDDPGLVIKFTIESPREGVDAYIQPCIESDTGLPLGNGASTERHFSMREFIELSSFDNKAKLLEMVNARPKPDTDCRPNKSMETVSMTRTHGDRGDQTPSSDDNNQENDEISEVRPLRNLGLQYYMETISRSAGYLLRSGYLSHALALLTGMVLPRLFTYAWEKFPRALPG